MGNEITRTRSQGIGLPVDGVEVWRDECLNLTEASPAPGVPQPAQATRTAVSASGQPTTDVDIKVQEPGIPAVIAPGETGIYQGATFLAKLNPDTDAEGWYGWDPAHIMSGIESVEFSATGGDSVRDVSICSLPSGAVVMAVDHVYLGDNRTDVYIMDEQSNQWGAIVPVAEYDSASVRGVSLVVLPSGRLHLYEVVNGFVRLWFSDDDGANWLFGGDKVSDSELAFSVSRISAAQSGGQVLMLIEGGIGQCVQYASNDLGVTLAQVGSAFGTAQIIDASVTAKSSGFMVAAEVSGGDVAYFAMESAFFRLLEDIPGQILVASPGSIYSTALAYDPTGVLYCFANIDETVQTRVSYDEGATFSEPSDYLGTFRPPGGSTRLVFESATWSQGRAIAAAIPSGSYGTRDIRAVTLGGFTNRTLGNKGQSTSDSLAAGFARSWASYVNPTSAGFTSAGSASFQGSDGAGGHIVVTAGSSFSYDNTTTLGTNRDVGARCRCQPNSTRALFELYNGTYGMRAEFGLGSVDVYDRTTSALLGSVAYVPADTSSIEIWFEVDHSKGYGIAWYRLNDFASSSNGKTGHRRREWAELCRSPLTSFVTGTTMVSFGNLTGSGQTTWYSVQVGESTSGRFYIDATEGAHYDDSTLRGRALASTTYALGGQYIRAAGGPSWRGEEWSLTSEPLYKVENTLNPNPRIGWRATQDAASEWLAYKWAEGDQVAESFALAVVVRGCNAYEVGVQTYEGGAWQDRGTYQPGPRQLPASNSQKGIAPSGGASTTYLQADEYSGATVYGYTGAATAKDTYSVGRVKHHTEGKWANTSVIRPVVLADRVVSATGMIDIVPEDFVILLETEADVQGVRLKLDPNGANPAPTAEGFWQVGSVDLYWVYPFGDEYAWGRSVETQARVEATRTRDGQVKHRVTAPPMRTLTLNWDPFDQSTVEADDADPDYVTFDQTNDGQAASRGGTALVLEGMVRRLNGPAGTVLYIPKMPTVDDSNSALLDRRREFMVGRIQEAIGAAYVLGDELESEVVNPGAMVIEEEV